MKYFPMLKNHAIAAVLSGLVGLVILTTASISHAQTGTEAKGTSTEKQAPSGWNKRDPKDPNNENWLTRTFGSSPEPVTPDQPAGSPPPVGGPPGKEMVRAGIPLTARRILHASSYESFGAPTGHTRPNRDMEENIGVGGAAG